MIYQTIGLLCLLVFVYSVTSAWVERKPVNGALVYTAFGLLLGVSGLGLIHFDLKAESIRVIVEVTLAVVLFSDAAGTEVGVLKRNIGLPERLLLIGLPLTILLGVGVGIVLLDGLTLLEIAILATMLAPTDAALGKAVVSDPQVPGPIRQGLNVESGLNDGICVPVLLAFLALAQGAEEEGGFLTLMLREIGLGVACGLGIAFLAARFLRLASARGWIDGTYRQLVMVSLALVCFSTAQRVGGSGFIAAFAGGMFFGMMAKGHRKQMLEAADATGDFLAMVTWTIFGAAVVGPALGSISWQVVLYALLSLTVIRMLPVAIALVGTRLKPAEKLFMGWFGPRGLASIVFAMIVFDTDLPGGDTVVVAVICTVLLSVVLHCTTANSLIKVLTSASKKGGK
ncbi:sodium:proton antiporter [Seongchinamella unica]|uniref:Sodium:proton antiporter n=1 Tax=Seongchinamella unica TaxID=2547392 RepID=A0A4R5LQK1_9GAMM|nr:cation:proton antiporter [Seongchinamella unica]TDG12810.1 sodium:proton antiporter [Seongchinamella unica]